MIMRRLLPAALLAAGLGLAPARAATVQPYAQAGFAAAQQAGKPILVFVEAPWCPTCAKERPILAKLYDMPEFKDLQVFTVDFDSSKPLLRELNVRMQSTLIVYRGGVETSRATGLTDADAIRTLLESSKG